ncbi:hypothetical protein V5799_010121 [Amblyomma americanum]|uniref:Uncharacterized protein n=1 Tax=Amblyomma americanum TaxID=6943 RepID=A0AAQ4FA64_AMBAM
MFICLLWSSGQPPGTSVWNVRLNCRCELIKLEEPFVDTYFVHIICSQHQFSSGYAMQIKLCSLNQFWIFFADSLDS